MKIEVNGNRCVSCYKFIQYYGITYQSVFEAIDCGYCVKKQKIARPGDRCNEYQEAGNAGNIIGAIKR